MFHWLGILVALISKFTSSTQDVFGRVILTQHTEATIPVAPMLAVSENMTCFCYDIPRWNCCFLIKMQFCRLFCGFTRHFLLITKVAVLKTDN